MADYKHDSRLARGRPSPASRDPVLQGRLHDPHEPQVINFKDYSACDTDGEFNVLPPVLLFKLRNSSDVITKHMYMCVCAGVYESSAFPSYNLALITVMHRIYARMHCNSQSSAISNPFSCILKPDYHQK